MDSWVITKISPPPPDHPLAAEWPGCATFTVENTQTHEIRNVTCPGEGCVEQMIKDGRFDEEPASPPGSQRPEEPVD